MLINSKKQCVLLKNRMPQGQNYPFEFMLLLLYCSTRSVFQCTIKMFPWKKKGKKKEFDKDTKKLVIFTILLILRIDHLELERFNNW